MSRWLTRSLAGTRASGRAQYGVELAASRSPWPRDCRQRCNCVKASGCSHLDSAIRYSLSEFRLNFQWICERRA